MHEQYLRRAIELAVENVRLGRGGPFGAVIVRDGAVLAEGVNEVTSAADPTAHAEVQAIRAACAKAGSFELKGAVLYASCEPCPMCLGAIYWARIEAVHYAASREDAAAAGFDDARIYDELPLPGEARTLPAHRHAVFSAAEPFALWREKTDKIRY